MSENRQKAKADRRSFLKLAGLGALSGGAMLALDKSPARASEVSVKLTGSYRETDHIRTYYESARF